MNIVEQRINDSMEHFRMMGDFDCGTNEYMNEFLKCNAYRCDVNGEGNTILLIDEDNHRIVGYYTIKCNAVQFESEQRVFPSIEISRFAIDGEYQGQGIGKYIFFELLNFIKEIRDKYIGAKYIILFASQSAVGFYDKFGFTKINEGIEVLCDSLNDECLGMYLAL